MDVTKLKQKHKIEEDTPWDDEPTETSKELAPVPVGYDDHIILEDGTEIINGKTYRPNQFKPGNREFEKRQNVTGTAPKIAIRKALEATSLRSLKYAVCTAGVERFMQEMNLLEGKDFITAFLSIAPYCMPKIAAVDFKSGETEAIPLEGRVHTITIKDFRTGVTTIINDD